MCEFEAECTSLSFLRGKMVYFVWRTMWVIYKRIPKMERLLQGGPVALASWWEDLPGATGLNHVHGHLTLSHHVCNCPGWSHSGLWTVLTTPHPGSCSQPTLSIIVVSPHVGTREECCGPQASAVLPSRDFPSKGAGSLPGTRPTPDMEHRELWSQRASLDQATFQLWSRCNEE